LVPLREASDSVTAVVTQIQVGMVAAVVATRAEVVVMGVEF
jgi:hypothetical protein